MKVSDIVCWRWKGEKTYVCNTVQGINGNLITFQHKYQEFLSWIDINEIDIIPMEP